MKLIILTTEKGNANVIMNYKFITVIIVGRIYLKRNYTEPSHICHYITKHLNIKQQVLNFLKYLPIQLEIIEKYLALICEKTSNNYLNATSKNHNIKIQYVPFYPLPYLELVKRHYQKFKD